MNASKVKKNYFNTKNYFAKASRSHKNLMICCICWLSLLRICNVSQKFQFSKVTLDGSQDEYWSI